MARLVYSCRFDVAAEDGILRVLSTYKDWIARQPGGHRSDGTQANHALALKLDSSGGADQSFWGDRRRVGG